MKDVILGIFDSENHVFNFIILLGKQYIYNARTCKQPLEITTFIRKLKDVYTFEHHMAVRNNKIDMCIQKWSVVNI